MKRNSSTITAISTLALASILMLVPPAVMAAKDTTSGVHYQGPRPTLNCSGSTCTSPSFTLAGLGQGTGTATLTVFASWPVTCSNPAGNVAPGQNTQTSASNGGFKFTSQNGKATVPSQSVTAQQPTPDQLNAACRPNGGNSAGWTGKVSGSPTLSARLVIDFNGQVLDVITYPPT